MLFKKLLNISQEKCGFAQSHKKNQTSVALKSRISRQEKLVEYYNVRRTLKINQKMQSFYGKVYCKSHVTFKNMKKVNETK